MDFDEYEYLENAIENPEKGSLEAKVNGEEKNLSQRLKHIHDIYDHDDSSPPSKRPRSGKDETCNRKKDRSSRHGSSSIDEEFEKDKSSVDLRNRNEEGSGKEKGRNRHRDRDRERKRDKENDQNRSRRKHVPSYEDRTEREGERYRLRQRKGLSETHADEQEWESGGRQGIAHKDINERHVAREFRYQDRGGRRYKEKKEEVETVADPERDQRTVFAYQISLKASEKDVYDFFSRAGKVRDVQLIMDRNSRRSKGFGYIEFYDVMSVPMGIALSGQLLIGQPVMVKPSEAEKNLVQPTSVTSGEGGLLGAGGAGKLYVGNLPVTIKEDQLRQVFESFGAVELVQMPTDPGTGNCKGYAFIQFTRLEDANAAQNLNGQLEIAGRMIKVSAVTDQAGIQNVGANINDFDDDNGSGLSLNAQSRALLMKNLDRTGTASSPGLSLPSAPLGSSSVHEAPGLAAAVLSIPAVTGPSIDDIGVPSECLLLKNMFDPNSETETDFDLDVKEDVQDECSKFGKLKHIYVDKPSAGCVYLRFENTQSSAAAQQALHGRWFAGKMITASFMVHHDYDAKFPDSS